MKVFVFEHCCGAMHAGDAAMLPLELLRQGAAMLKAVIADLLELEIDVTTMAHDRVTGLDDRTHAMPVETGTDVAATFDTMAREADAALVIAPESDSLLARYQARLDELDVHSLGCTLDAIRLCGDKLKLAEHFKVCRVPTPPTVLLDENAEKLTFPIVVKPQFGAGCEQTYLLRSASELASIPRDGEPLIAQPFVNGLDCSCAVIVHGTQLTPLIPGEQHIRGEARLTWSGGRFPLAAPLAKRAQKLAVDAVAWIPGARGYVGVDMILGDQPADDRVIEINPRLTMSYPPLRRLCATNLAAAILDADAPIKWLPGHDRYDQAGKPVKDPHG